MTTKKVTVTVYNGEINYTIPTNPIEFMKYWQELLNRVPSEYKESTTIELEPSDDGYGCNTLDLTINYTRPETSEEATARLANQVTRQDIQTEKELKQLEYLKNKYQK